jgi:undecaprenyl-diphosphatase
MKNLIAFDKWLMLKINRDAANTCFDHLMPFLRQPLLWIPFYFFLVVFVLVNFPKKAAGWIVCLATTATLTDLLSSKLIKPAIGRMRPCNDPELFNQVRLLVGYCGQNGSFTSSHAANHFGVAMFLFITLKDFCGPYRYLFFLWAAIICYAQIYVGVHFPGDIAGGAVLGLSIGWMAASLYLRYAGSISPISTT